MRSGEGTKEDGGSFTSNRGGDFSAHAVVRFHDGGGRETRNSGVPEAMQFKLKARLASRVPGERPHPHARTRARAQRRITGGGCWRDGLRGANRQRREGEISQQVVAKYL
jgi:hypothetical protein